MYGTRSMRAVEPVPVTRDDVIEAAAAIIADGGYEALNMRALAERAGVPTASLYRIFDNKEQLLGAVADRMFGEADLLPAADEEWEAQLVHLFTGVHRLLLGHPELAEIAAKQHINGRAAWAAAERTIAVMRSAGIGAEQAARAFTALVAYTTGFAQRQLGSNATSMGHRWGVVQELAPEQFPNVTALSHVLIPRPSDEQFEQGLRIVIRGFA
jgi:TetR/AcrR family tetracycline transcriptional repressor